MGSISTSQHHLKVVSLESQYTPLLEVNLPAPYSCEVVSHERTRVDQVAERIKDADIIIMTVIKLSAELLSGNVCPRLKMISVVASGTDPIDLETCKARGIHVANSPHCNEISVAEHAISSYFATRRSITLSHTLTRKGEWHKRGTLMKIMVGPDGKQPRTTASETMGILGWGAIGKKIASIAEALGMKVLVSSRKGSPASEGRTDFEAVIRESSVIVLCLPRSPETIDLISHPELDAMPSHAVLVNVSRGGIVNEEALVKALREKKIAGAATDVYGQEPAGPEDSPLLAPDTDDLNLVTTPHVAWCAEDTNDNYNNCLRENISSWLLGNPTNSVI